MCVYLSIRKAIIITRRLERERTEKDRKLTAMYMKMNKTGTHVITTTSYHHHKQLIFIISRIITYGQPYSGAVIVKSRFKTKKINYNFFYILFCFFLLFYFFNFCNISLSRNKYV